MSVPAAAVAAAAAEDPKCVSVNPPTMTLSEQK